MSLVGIVNETCRSRQTALETLRTKGPRADAGSKKEQGRREGHAAELIGVAAQRDRAVVRTDRTRAGANREPGVARRHATRRARSC